jgi:hypothetical protein
VVDDLGRQVLAALTASMLEASAAAKAAFIAEQSFDVFEEILVAKGARLVDPKRACLSVVPRVAKQAEQVGGCPHLLVGVAQTHGVAQHHPRPREQLQVLTQLDKDNSRNIIASELEIRVIDFEQSHLGTPAYDLSYILCELLISMETFGAGSQFGKTLGAFLDRYFAHSGR